MFNKSQQHHWEYIGDKKYLKGSAPSVSTFILYCSVMLHSINDIYYKVLKIKNGKICLT